MSKMCNGATVSLGHRFYYTITVFLTVVLLVVTALFSLTFKINCMLLKGLRKSFLAYQQSSARIDEFFGSSYVNGNQKKLAYHLTVSITNFALYSWATFLIVNVLLVGTILFVLEYLLIQKLKESLNLFATISTWNELDQFTPTVQVEEVELTEL